MTEIISFFMGIMIGIAINNCDKKLDKYQWMLQREEELNKDLMEIISKYKSIEELRHNK